jgi:putative membrane protein
MSTLNAALTGASVLQHIAFFFLESVFWLRPWVRKIFRVSSEAALATRALAFNQGVYNLFLSASLLLALFPPLDEVREAFQNFGVLCVLVAAGAGGWSVSSRILWIQGTLPMLVVLLKWFGASR